MVGIAGIDGILFTRSPRTSHGPLAGSGAGRQWDEPEKIFFNIKSITSPFFHRLKKLCNFHIFLMSV